MRTLVITGGTGGIGQAAIRYVLSQPDWRVIALTRKGAPIPGLTPHEAGRVTPVAADLADLKATARACDDVIARLGGGKIDALSLNAGVQLIHGDPVSADGFELHFAVNHLAHVLVADRLVPHMRAHGHLVVTSSETHDPAEFCLVGITRLTWQDPLELADAARSQRHIPDALNRGEARYSASKLANVMHARTLAREHPEIAVVSYNPSVVAATGIARERNGLQRYLWRTLFPLLTPVLPGARSIARSAGDLAWLLTKADLAKASGAYFDGRKIVPGSPDSRHPAKIARMMQVSRELIAGALQQEAPVART